MSDLPSDRQEVLLELHDRLTSANISYQLGGSGMLVLRGLSAAVHDLDLIFPGEVRDRVAVALGDWFEKFASIEHPHFSSDWYAQIRVDDVPVDLVGGFTIRGEGPLPFREDARAAVAGVQIPLAPVDQWIRIYENYDPRKAELLRKLER